MIYPIVKFGDPVLEKPAAPITVFDDELKKLVEDMFESIALAHGAELGRTPIGISKRLAVIDITLKRIQSPPGLGQPRDHSPRASTPGNGRLS